MIDYREIKFEEAVEHHLIHHGYSKADSKNFDRALTCISHRTLRVALWRRLFSLPRRLSSRRMDREPLPPHVSARVPRRQPKRLRREQLAPCRLKGDEKSRLALDPTVLLPFIRETQPAK
jgi:hypothetical protein